MAVGIPRLQDLKGPHYGLSYLAVHIRNTTPKVSHLPDMPTAKVNYSTMEGDVNIRMFT